MIESNLIHNVIQHTEDKKMSSYRINKQKKYKKRRALIISIGLLAIVAIAMAVYLFFNKVETAGTIPTDSSKSAAAQTGTSQNTSTPSDSTAATGTNTDAVSTQSSAQSTDKDGVETKDHGFLPNIGSVKKSGKMDGLKKLITDYTSGLSGKYGVTFIDLATGEMVNVNDTDRYIAASTSKLPINVLLYKYIEEGKVNMDDILTYQKEDFEPGTGIIQKSAYGTQYTVRETSKLAIRKSDNCGVNMIIRLLDIQNIRQYLVDLGGKVYYDERHRSCPYDMALVAQDLYKHYLKNEAVYGDLINDLENTDWRDRIDAKLTGVKVAHKIGNQVKTANDVGIVFASHPYVLSIMADNVDFGTACKNEATLSKMIYDYVEGYAGSTDGLQNNN